MSTETSKISTYDTEIESGLNSHAAATPYR